MDEKEEFSRRLNELCDEMGVPPKGQNRQAALAKIFSVSQKAARKWLEAERFPSTLKQIKIAKWANVNSEWLRSGRGLKREASTEMRLVLQRLLHAAEPLPDYKIEQVIKIVSTIAEPAPDANQFEADRDRAKTFPSRRRAR